MNTTNEQLQRQQLAGNNTTQATNDFGTFNHPSSIGGATPSQINFSPNNNNNAQQLQHISQQPLIGQSPYPPINAHIMHPQQPLVNTSGMPGVPMAALGGGDLSVNSSFQNDINSLVNAVNRQYSHQIEQYLEQRKEELQTLTQKLIDERQRFRYTHEQSLAKHLSHMKDNLREQMKEKMESIVQSLQIQKEKTILAQQEKHSVEMRDVERTRLQRKVDIRLQQERNQMEAIHNLELERIRVEREGKLTVAKQRLLLQEDIPTSKDSQLLMRECEKLRIEVAELRDKCDLQIDAARAKAEEEYRQKVKEMRADVKAIREREESKVVRAFKERTQEECLSMYQRNEEQMDKKEAYKRELKEQMNSRIAVEKNRINLEQQEKLRDLKIHSQKELESAKSFSKAKLDLDQQRSQNTIQIEHYRLLREIQLQHGDKFKVLKEAEAKKDCSKLDQNFTAQLEQLVKEQNSATQEHSKCDQVLKEIQTLKRKVKQGRLLRKDHEKTLHYEQLSRQSLNIKFETLKRKITEEKVQSAAEREKNLQKELKKKEEELKEVQADYDRVKNYQKIEIKGGSNDLTKDLEDVKNFIKTSIEKGRMTESDDITEKDLNELALLVPREIDKVEEKQMNLTNELNQMQSLLQIVSQDMLAGVGEDTDFKSGGVDRKHQSVQNMLVEYKVSVDQQKQVIQRDISKIERQLSLLRDSLNLLYDLKRKVENAKRLAKLSRAESEIEGKEDIRRMRNEFKHYVREQWLLKFETENDGQDIDELLLRQRGAAPIFPAIDYAYLSQKHFGNTKRPASAILRAHHQTRERPSTAGMFLNPQSPLSTAGGAQWAQIVQMMRP